MTLDQTTYPADSGIALEVSYEIPYTSLTFLREGGDYVARLQISVQVTDKRRDVVAGDAWQKVVRLAEYNPTVARDSVESGTVVLALPANALDARIQVQDQSNERAALAQFRIDRPAGGLLLKLFKSGKPASMRKYGIGDTLVAAAEAAGSGDRLDSCRFVLKRGRRVVAGATLAAAAGVSSDSGVEGQGDAAKPRAVYRYPIGDSTAVAVLGGGEYVLEVTGLGPGRVLSATARFRVEVPLFLDDSAFLRRVDQLVYVATAEEMRRLRSLPRAEREQAWRDFWQKRDQTPTTERNEREDEYFERIDYAQEHFRHGDRGYLSDRGHVYVRYGAPDQIDSRPFDIDSPAVEVWYYYQLNKQFEFVDRFGAGEYILQNRAALLE